MFQGPLDRQLYFADFEWFDQEVYHAVLQGRYRVIHRWVPGHHNDRYCIVEFMNLAGELYPVHSRHIKVCKTKIDPRVPENLECFRSISGS